MKRSTAWLIFVTVSAMYCLVFMQRTGPGLIAQKLMEQYAIAPTTLSLMTVAQYLTYAALQIPVGLFAVRMHPERLLALGAFCDGLGTILFGTSTSFHAIIFSRVIVGIGDAMVWLNIVLVLGKWYDAGVCGRILGFVGMSGNLGAILSTFPLAWWIARDGYREPFVALGVVLVVVSLLSAWLLEHTTPVRPPLATGLYRPNIQTVFHKPWDMMAPILAHWGFMGPFLGFASLFAIPMLHTLYGMNAVQGGYYLALALLGSLMAGPIVGPLSDRFGRKIPYLLVGIVDVLAWGTFAAFAPILPRFILAAIFLVLGFANGASVLTFAVIRDTFTSNNIGLASGIANTAGFLSAVCVPWGIGFLLSAGPGLDISARDQWALAYVTLFSALGTLGTLKIAGKAKKKSAVGA
ncbi:hypothetical protein BXT84_05575 [Sulfobacillus thermotolerans]|uniref:Major facilitator superfamily (MFS) profile domain-containing protein n=1 Tax=Sulfobacillus thermotolerans TaxID=338644 RepID=A0ABM6RQ69_9FIRM|nr:hypothetical protein BXT84_05575 [Sulfobacillus thermotolerans]